MGQLFSLDSAVATWLFWVAVLMLGGGLFLPSLLPCIDYPQHLGLSDLARRLDEPGSPEAAQFVLNKLTYNGLFHLLVAQFSRVVSVELAGKGLLAFALVLLSGAVLALLRTLGRPSWLAALFVPVVFSSSVAWGFANFTLGTSFAVAACVFVARALRRPSMGAWLGAAVVGVLCAMTHVLATLNLCLLALCLAPEVALRSTRDAPTGLLRPWRALGRAVLALSPVALAAAYCIAVFVEQYAWAPAAYRDPALEGTSPTVGHKLLYLTSYATGLYPDGSDQALLFVVLGFLGLLGAWSLWRRWAPSRAWAEEPRPSLAEPVLLPLVGLLAAYLLVPMVFVGTHLIFPRLAQGVFLGLILAVPVVPLSATPWVPSLAAAVALVSSAHLAVRMELFGRETEDASRVLEAAPVGRRAAAVMYEPGSNVFTRGLLVHFAGYYGARKQGDWAFSFARYLSVPVRFRPGEAPPWPGLGWEFEPENYRPRCAYARHFDLVFVKAPAEIGADPVKVRAKVFGPDADRVQTLSHHGVWYLFDTADVPSDGTP